MSTGLPWRDWTSWRDQSCRNRSLDRDSSPTSWTKRVVSVGPDGLAEAGDQLQLPDAGRYGLTLGTAPPVTRPCGQAEQVIGSRMVEVQDPGQRIADLDGGVAVAALLEPQVVVGADPGEHRDLFAPQPRDSTHPVDPQANRLGPISSAGHRGLAATKRGRKF